MKKFFISTLASVIMLASMVSITSAATTTFVDIADSYAKDAIIELQAKGIINGMDDSHFDPKGTLTRAQFVTIIVKALGLEAKATTSAFTDVTDWAIPYVEAAAKVGVVEGVSNNNFAPDEHITREAAVTILVRSLKTKGKLDEATTVNFTDADRISAWAKPFIASALQYGLISGYPDGTFDPTGIANREMAAIMGKNLLAAIVKVTSVTQAPTTQEPTVTTPTTPTIIGGGGGGGSRGRSGGGGSGGGDIGYPRPEAPTIIGGKATFANGTTVEGIPAGATIIGHVVPVTETDGIKAAGQAMNFTYTGDKPPAGFIVSFPTTSKDAGLSFFNAARNKWELQGDSSMDDDGKIVKATVPHFSIYGPIVMSAQLIADSVTTIEAPAKDAASLTLPKVATGFTVAIKSSDKPDVIALDGTITPPSVETTVGLVLEVTRTSDGTKATTTGFVVVVPAKTETPQKPTVVEFQKKPSFIGAFTSDFRAIINGKEITNYSLYYDNKLVGTTTNGVVTSVNNVFSEISKIKITDTTGAIYLDSTGDWK